MEFDFDLAQIFLLPVPKDKSQHPPMLTIVVVGADLLPITGQVMRLPQHLQGTVAMRISQVVDTMGELSAKAQGLKVAVTSATRLRHQAEQFVYLVVDQESNSVLGMLKVGRKSLFLADQQGQIRQLKPLCVLDFFVHPDHRRQGLGKWLFEHMLKHREVEHPQALAIDRPSEKLLAFLDKKFGLNQTISQVNNFVVYKGFFEANHSSVQDKGEGEVAQMVSKGDERNKRPRIYMGKLQYV